MKANCIIFYFIILYYNILYIVVTDVGSYVSFDRIIQTSSDSCILYFGT